MPLTFHIGNRVDGQLVDRYEWHQNKHIRATLLLWERRRPHRQESWRERSRPTGTSAIPGDKPFDCNKLTLKKKKKRAAKS
jgi:hypothetical protein